MNLEQSAAAFKAVIIQAKTFIFDGEKFQPEDGYFIGKQKTKWYVINQAWKLWQTAIERQPCLCLEEEAVVFQQFYNTNGMLFDVTRFRSTGKNNGMVAKAVRVNWVWRAWLIAVGRGEYHDAT